MRKIAIILFLGFYLLDLSAQNPFEKIGKDVEVLTLSKGKYDEFDDKDTLVRMGSVMFNTITNKIEYFIAEEILISESDLKPYIVGRFWRKDPLAMLYPMDSPYMFAGNSPIMMIDVDGMYKYPVTINYKGHTYEAVLNSKNTQKIKLRLADKGNKSKWLSINYTTSDPTKMSYGYSSLSIFINRSGNDIDNTSVDVKLFTENLHFVTPGNVLNVNPSELIGAILDSENGVGLSILAGNSISGKRPIAGSPDGAYLIKNMIFIHGFDVKIIPLLNTYNDSPWFEDWSNGFQQDFNTLRANTLQNAYFKGVDNVTAISRQDYDGNMIGTVALPPYDADPVGITVSFDFSKPKRKSKTKKTHTMPKATQKSKNPRFL